MKRSLVLKSALGGLAVLAAYLGGAWFFSGLIVQFQPRSLEEDRVNVKLKSPRAFGLGPFEEVRIPSDRIELHAWFYPGRNKTRPCGIVASHGRRGTRYGALKYLQLFQERGCSFLVFDARRHGSTPGKYATYGHRERRDLRRALAYLRKKTGLANRNIGLIGESMGGAISLQAAAVEKDLAFVAADSPYYALSAILTEQGRAQYGPLVSIFLGPAILIAELRSGSDLGATAPILHAPNIQVPVFLLHSRQDKFTRPYHSQRIYDRIKHKRKVVHFTNDGAKHGFSIDVNRTAYQNRLDAFLKKHVPHW